MGRESPPAFMSLDAMGIPAVTPLSFFRYTAPARLSSSILASMATGRLGTQAIGPAPRIAQAPRRLIASYPHRLVASSPERWGQGIH